MLQKPRKGSISQRRQGSVAPSVAEASPEMGFDFTEFSVYLCKHRLNERWRKNTGWKGIQTEGSEGWMGDDRGDTSACITQKLSNAEQGDRVEAETNRCHHQYPSSQAPKQRTVLASWSTIKSDNPNEWTSIPLQSLEGPTNPTFFCCHSFSSYFNFDISIDSFNRLVLGSLHLDFPSGELNRPWSLD